MSDIKRSIIDYPIVAKTHPPMYSMHRFRARKPHNVVAEYIRNYCEENGIVLDMFCGSGVTIIEAVAQNRRAIGIDLNPLSIFITKTTLVTANIGKLQDKFVEIENTIKTKIYEIPRADGKLETYRFFDLFKTKCPLCNSSALILSIAYSFIVECPECHEKILISECEKGEKQGVYYCHKCGEKFGLANVKLIDIRPIKIEYKCYTNPNHTSWKDPSSEDLKFNKYIEINLKPPFYAPNQNFYYQKDKPFLTKRRIDNIGDLFSVRNLIALSIIYHEIEKIKDENVRNLFKMAFSAGLETTCRLNPLRPRHEGYSTNSGWTVHEYWVPAIHVLRNPWLVFMERVNKVIKGKKNAEKRVKGVKFGEDINSILQGRANVYLVRGSALDLLNYMCEKCKKRGKCEGCVDFIFTDPPYGKSLQYYELDFFRNAWLFPKEIDWWKEEIVINEKQEKDVNIYYSLLKNSFENTWKVLKPDHYMVVTFHSSFIEVYNTVIRAAHSAGFDLEKIIYQPPAVRSAKQSLHPYTSAVGDYYIQFRKGSDENREKKRKLRILRDEDVFERIVLLNIRRIIAERGEPTDYTTILKEIYPPLSVDGYLIYAKPERIRDILHKYENKEFIFTTGGWWFKNPSKYLLDRIPLRDRLERAVIDILRRNFKVKFDDVLQYIYSNFTNALTPERQNVLDILREYAEPADGDKWRLRRTVEVHISKHDKIIESLAQIGARFGFHIWIGKREQQKGKLSKYVSPKFKHKFVLPIEDKLLEQVENIDILWIKKDKVVYGFEVEYTTAITEAVRRLKSIPYDAKRVIVIPKEGERRLKRKVEYLISVGMMNQEDVNALHILFFDDIKSVCNANSLKDFEKVLKQLTLKMKGLQTKITAFK